MASKTIVLITGGNTGIGLETVKALLGSASSYHIILGSRSLDKANTVISVLKSTFGTTTSTIEPIQIDVTSDESISAAFDQTKSKHGRLDTLINNAGKQEKFRDRRCALDWIMTRHKVPASTPKLAVAA